MCTFVNIKHKKHITIKQFQRLNKIESNEDIETRILQASILSDTPTDTLKAMELPKLAKFVNDTIDSYDFDFKPKNHKETIMVNGTKYYIVSDMHKIIAGQLMDLSTYAKNEEEVIDNLHYIVAILLRENKKEYSGETLDDRALLMQDYCSYNDIYDVAVFFCKILTKLQPLLEEMMRKSLLATSNDGDGSFI